LILASVMTILDNFLRSTCDKKKKKNKETLVYICYFDKHEPFTNLCRKNVKELIMFIAGFGFIILRLNASMPHFDF